MYVIHAVWSAAGFAGLWGEDSTLSAATQRVRDRAGWPRHPFAASEKLGTVLGLPVEHRADLAMLLPSMRSEPAPSPELVRPVSDPPATRQANRRALAAWRVPVIALPAGYRLRDMWSLAHQHEDLAPGVTLRWLASVEEFAADLLGRGRVVPSIRAEPGALAARWRPVLTGLDAAALHALATAAPPACRAEIVGGGPRATHEVLAEALAGLVDQLARARLHHLDLVPPDGAGRLAERWLAALTAEDATIDVPADADIGELGEALDAWHAALHAGAGPLRACFRLTEPALEDGDRWRVEFLLQATEEPSLLIAAAAVWSAADRALATSYGKIADPQEALLTGLGRASRLYPELDRELRTRHPTALELDAAGAQRFLRTAAPLLLEAGFGVLLPTWWSQRRARIGLKLRASPAKRDPAAAPAGLGLDALVDFRWELALGEEALTEQELAELAAHKAALVRVRGRWVEVDQAELARAAEFVATRRGAGQTAARDVLAAAVHPDRAADGLPVVSVDASGWLGALLDGNVSDGVEPVPVPATFAATLRPYQERGLAWLNFLSRLGLGACLADDMGLGKTVQLLGLLSVETNGASPAGPTLVVCPMSVVGNWQREAARFAPKLRVYVHHGTTRLAGDEFRVAAQDADLVLTTYPLASRDIDRLAGVSWRRVVLDEAQNIKNSQARQTQAIRRLPASHRIALTGTPVENRLSELWSIMEFLNPGLLGPATAFRERFAVPIERYGDEDAAARLRRATQPFILRRVKTDKTIIDDLPDKIEMRVLCNLTAEQASLYQAVVDDMLGKIDSAEGIERRGLVLATMAKLKQVCNHPAHLLRDGSRLPGRSGKLARLEEIAEEVVADGDKALVFTQFAEFGALLQPYLTGRLQVPVLFLHGGTRKKVRDEYVERFQGEDGPAIFLLSLRAGGTGLNLTAANHVIHFDRWWNPAVEDQATDRAFRIGQRRDVQVRKFVSIGTLEERIDAMIEEKKALAAMVVGTGETWLTELSTDELRALVALDPDAVSE